MGKRSNPKIATGLRRYIIGIHEYYAGRGMRIDSAKIKSVNETYEVMASIIEQDKDVPDYLVIAGAEHMVRVLNKRGQQISELVKTSKNEDEIEAYRKSLRDLKTLVDNQNAFISEYKGAVIDEKKEK